MRLTIHAVVFWLLLASLPAIAVDTEEVPFNALVDSLVELPPPDLDAIYSSDTENDVDWDYVKIRIDKLLETTHELTSSDGLVVAFAATRLSDWFGREPSYRNILLSDNCNLLAFRIAAICGCDLEVSASSVRDLLKSVRETRIGALDRARLLDSQLGGNCFESAVREEDLSSEIAILNLARRASAFNKLVQLESVPLDIVEKSFKAEDLLAFEQMKPTAALLSGGDPWVTTSLLQIASSKVGFNQLARLESLLSFREAIGEFPTRTTLTNHPFANDIQSAFYEIWMKDDPKNNPEIALRAALLYTQVAKESAVTRPKISEL